MTSQRLGLSLIIITLVAVGAGAALLLDNHRREHLARIEGYGTELIGMLSRMPLDTLAPPLGQRGPLELLASGAGNGDLAYVEVLDAAGVTRASMTRIPSLPPAAVGETPAAWAGVRQVDVPGEGTLREHFDALVADGVRVGHVRIGLREPGLAPSLGEMRMLALFALTAFLLVPAFYYLVRREVRPLARMGDEISRAVADNPLWNVKLARPSDVREFVANFNQLVRTAEDRMRSLEEERSEILTQSKVVSYAKARIESVLQSLPEGVVVLDEAGTVAYVNDKIGPMLGVNTATMEGEQPATWSPNPELTAWLNNTGQSRGKSSVKGTLEIPDLDGDGRIAVSAYPLFSPRERLEVLGTLVVFDDITAEAMARDARKDLIAQLSHELKTPLHVMGMYSEMLLEEDADAEAIRIEAGNVIHDEVERVTALINNMLSISRIEMGSVQLKRRRTRLGDLLQDALDNVSRSGTGRDLQFSLELPPELSVVNVDKDLMRVAINNLLTNAIKYNREGGSVVLGANENDDEMVMFVRDTGIGIPAEDQEHVFDRFYRGKNGENGAASGHGLGLPLAREIINVHLGQIELESTPGEGTEFRIRLRKTASLIKEAA